MPKQHTKRRVRSTHRRNRRTHHKRHLLKRKHRGGGKLDRLPLAANPAIDAFLGLPDGPAKKQELIRISKEVHDEFENDWDFKLVMGHGELIPGEPAIVPENTYIVFNSPAGCIALAENGVPMLGLTVGTTDEFRSKLALDHILRKGIFDTPDPVERIALVGRGCYNPSFFENTGDYFAGSTKKLGPLEAKRTIYGPGEPVPEMKIKFANNLYEQLVLGVFDLPISREFHDRVMASYSLLRDEGYRTAIAAQAQDEKTKKRLLEGGQQKTYEQDQKLFGRADTLNYKPQYVSAAKSWQEATAEESPADRTLTEILADLPPLEAGKKRLLFIGSCRGLTCKLPKNIKPALTQSARRASLVPRTMGVYVAALSCFNTLQKEAEGEFAAKHSTGVINRSNRDKIRQLVKGLTISRSVVNLSAVKEARIKEPEMFKKAQEEVARQKAAAAAGAAPLGSNNAFVGGPYE